MKIQLVIYLLISAIAFSCGDMKTPDTAIQASPDSTHFFSTTRFYEEQLNQVKVFKKPIYYAKTIDNGNDSGTLSIESFTKYVDEFIQKDISSPERKKYYRETVFQDAGTQSYTLSYTAVDKTMPVQGVDILLDEQSNQVKRIFIRSFSIKGDTSIQERHNWHAFKSFQINRTISIGKTIKEELTEVRWGNHSDGE